MDAITSFDPQLEARLPAAHTLLMSANLALHPAVTRVILHGSRGLAGNFRPDSDIDLSLIIDGPVVTHPANQADLFQAVLEATLTHWHSSVEPDLAVVFDVRSCGLSCFDRERWDGQPCTYGSLDCFGLYKIQKGFNGLVTNTGVDVRRMYPCLKIWQRCIDLH
ncbi:MAG TPA: nucleotidyltransferase domain-containing protein [Longilinea sp.]|nr:nucleotidyltransferase domain-containing protein [Longilinea sp.]